MVAGGFDYLLKVRVRDMAAYRAFLGEVLSKVPGIRETHTYAVMENVKELVITGGGTMDSILQLTVFLTKIEDFDLMNKVFKTYFPNGGPARTTVAVAALPGNSLVEINCTAAVTNAKEKR